MNNIRIQRKEREVLTQLKKELERGPFKRFEFEMDFDFGELPGGSDGKSVCVQCRRAGFDPWFGKIPWRRKWQPIPVLLPGKSHGQRSLVGYSPWGRKESHTTE